MRKLATIRTVESVNPIEGADRIEYITMKDLGWKAFKSLDTLEKMLEFAKGKTALGHEREGVVFKSMDGNYSFKCINNNYLLKEVD